MTAGEGALAPLPLARSRFPADGAGRLLAVGVCEEGTAVLFSNTRGDPCLGFLRAKSLLDTYRLCRALQLSGAPTHCSGS